jgi:hypothetical protein
MPRRADDASWFEDRFTGPDLAAVTWSLRYPPAWSSLVQTRASYRVDDGLVLDIPLAHPLWCPSDHEPQLRVSGIQSGSWSGPVGSVYGHQRFREGQVVREQQDRFDGWLPTGGRVEISAFPGGRTARTTSSSPASSSTGSPVPARQLPAVARKGPGR